MTAPVAIAFTLGCVAVYVVACDIMRAPVMRRLHDRLTRERNRNRFGEVRTKLVRLAADGQVNPRSQLFMGMYGATTNLMRNPYALEEAAQAILTIPAPNSTRRRSRPTPIEGEIVRDFARRIDLLCRDYSHWYSMAAWLNDRCDGPARTPPLWIRMILARAEQRKQIRPIAEARARLERLAA